ncbi:Rer1 family protein [Cladochytrium replicatum]|nr:Rer1 family protein [Cladochytrium replicatum]
MMEPEPPVNVATKYWVQVTRRYQKLLDDVTPYTEGRWAFTALCMVIYFLRVFLVQGWYIVTYALGIYLLNLLLGFLSPKFDPALEELDNDEEDGQSSLPLKNDEEFRPFVRRLAEFKFWHAATRAFIIAFFCTLFSIFDIPVFWPILLMYFIVLFTVTMRRQIRHMIRYRYLPWNFGKKRYSIGGGKK